MRTVFFVLFPEGQKQISQASFFSDSACCGRFLSCCAGFPFRIDVEIRNSLLGSFSYRERWERAAIPWTFYVYGAAGNNCCCFDSPGGHNSMKLYGVKEVSEMRRDCVVVCGSYHRLVANWNSHACDESVRCSTVVSNGLAARIPRCVDQSPRISRRCFFFLVVFSGGYIYTSLYICFYIYMHEM